jgi:hypothetical protein
LLDVRVFQPSLVTGVGRPAAPDLHASLRLAAQDNDEVGPFGRLGAEFFVGDDQ